MIKSITNLHNQFYLIMVVYCISVHVLLLSINFKFSSLHLNITLLVKIGLNITNNICHQSHPSMVIFNYEVILKEEFKISDIIKFKSFKAKVQFRIQSIFSLSPYLLESNPFLVYSHICKSVWFHNFII